LRCCNPERCCLHRAAAHGDVDDHFRSVLGHMGPGHFLTMDSAALKLAPLGCGCCRVRVFRQNLHSRMPLDPMHVRLKLLHAFDQ
jgi:hypothetical protein